MPPAVEQLRARASSTLAGFSLGQKVVTGIAALALIVGAVTFSSWASKPTYVPLFSNLASSDAASITQKLSSQKISYKLADGGQTILVPQGRVYQTRLDMSAAGLPSGGSSGYSLLDKQGITTSEFTQRVDYQRALEGELEKTIEAIDGVSAARVHLVIPQQDVFAVSTTKPSASVLVMTIPGKSLDGGQAQAIVHLVSSSVEGLDPNDVTVADSKGRVLSAPGSDAGDSAAGDTQSSQTRSFEDSLSSSLQDMLAQVIGPNHAVVRVTADLDYDQKQTTTETFANDKQAPAVSSQTSKETYTGGNPGSVGILGATGVTTPAGGAGSNYNKEDATTTYAVGKVTEQVKQAPGTVRRLSVAVAVDSAAKSADKNTVQQLVTAAAGITPSRGDTLSVDVLPFDTSAAQQQAKELKAVASARSTQSMMAMAKTVGLLIAVAVVLFLVVRSSKRAPMRVPLALPHEMAQLEAPRTARYPTPDASLAAGAGGRTGPKGALAASGDPYAHLATADLPPSAVAGSDIVQLIERQPDEVAELLRSWLADRRG